MNPTRFAKLYLETVEFNCECCRMYEYGRNCKNNNKSACVQVKKYLLKMLNDKINADWKSL